MTVRPRQSVTIDDAAVGPERDDRQVGASWDWRCNLSIDAPQSRDLCFTTPGAPGSHACEPIERVTIAGR